MKVLSLLLVALCALHVCFGLYVYVGTQQTPPGGIVVFTQQGNGALSNPRTISANSPMFLAFSPNGKNLYATGNLSYISFAVNTDGSLKQLNTINSGGQDPCHLEVYSKGDFLFGANYGDGSFVSFRLNSNDGSISALADTQVPGQGDLTNADRQSGPHAHQIINTPNGQVVGVDLGADRMFTFNVNTQSGKLTPGTVPYGQVSSGSGSRHMVFHPNGNYAYVVCELSSDVQVFSYNSGRGSFTFIQSISGLVQGWSGNAQAAEIRVHPSGDYVYSTNRGPDTVAAFSVDKSTGKLSFLQSISTHGAWPRGMNIDPTGRFLYVGNQNGNNVVAYTISQGSGVLTFLDQYPVNGATDIEFHS